MRKTGLSVMAVAIAQACGTIAAAQTAYPPAGYSALLFDPVDTKYVFRLNGAPWICRGDTFCKPVKIDGVADKDLPQATIEPLGHAGRRYLLAYQQANFEKGKQTTLSCVDERCSKLDATVGTVDSLGTFEVKQSDDRVATRVALLRSLEARNGRAQLLWCTENDCSEMPLTRDSEQFLALIGAGRSAGRSTAWLRDRSGAVLACTQPEEGVSDQLACERSPIVLNDFPANQPVAAAPPPPAPAPQPIAGSDADRTALAAAIDRAIGAGDFGNADRLLIDAGRRYAGNAAWPSLQQKLAKARADHDARLRQTEARRLITEALRFADAGDFSHAEQMLQEADKHAPGFAETSQARAQIAARRTERGERYRERYQYLAAVDQAVATEHYWEAERLLRDYAQRFGQDNDYRSQSDRLAQRRNAAVFQARLAEARADIARARQAMERGDFAEAERQLAQADRSAPGFPEIGDARADLSRRRIAFEQQQDGLRLLLSAIESAFQRRQYDDAEHTIEEGRRRYGSYSGWADLQNRTAAGRRGDDRQANELRQQNARALELVTQARRNTTQGDFAAADKALADARRIAPATPEIALAVAELERAKADHARQDAEIRALAASIDAALARRQFADAERLLGDGQKRFPSYQGWGDLSRRLAEARRASPTQTGNAPMPAIPPTQPTQSAQPTPPAPMTPPAQTATPPARPATTPPAQAATPPAAPATPPAQATAPPARPAAPPAQAATPPAPPATPPAQAATPPAPPPAQAGAPQPNVTQLVAAAREAIKRGDYRTAEKAVADAEKADPKAPAIAEVRAELKTAEEKARQDHPRNPPPSTATLPPIPPAPGAAPARPQ